MHTCTQQYPQQRSRARLHQADFPVLAGGSKKTSICIERHGQDNIWVVTDGPHGVLYHRLRTVQVPDHYLEAEKHTEINAGG